MSFWGFGDENMRCREVARKLSAFLDEELSREEYLKVQRHLEMCALCRKEYEKFALVRAVARKLGDITPRVVPGESFSLERAFRSVWRSRVLWALVAVLGLFVALLVFWGWQRASLEEQILDVEHFAAFSEDVLTRGKVRVETLEFLAGEYR
ncbi:anti-sigma factor family protein [Candidatus Caldatribacterium sp. SIUC1]|uniref:anti-sigma factor family protein n=1 Tax=Candidatus Caldatribacterium sp. SIUC1 TaxID=3418365 RepID=UPI003F68D5EA